MPTTDELAADLEAVKASTPTLEELCFSMVIPCWNNGIDKLPSATAMTLLVAPMPLRVLSVACSWEYWNLAASDAAYWKGELSKGNGAGYSVFATKTTQNTGAYAGGGIVARRAWTFDSANWGNADLAQNDLLRLSWSPTGAPASDLDMPFTLTIRARPL